VTETEVSAVAREVKVVQSFSSFWIWERGVSARDELAAKKRKRPQKTEAPLLKIGLAFFAAIESGCFSGMPSTPEGAAERGEEGEKSDSGFSTSVPFLRPSDLLFCRIGLAFLAAIQAGGLALIFRGTKSILFHVLPRKTIKSPAFQKSAPAVSS
jgi:hypothetical protein